MARSDDGEVAAIKRGQARLVEPLAEGDDRGVH
jgi:hypothetical protein